MKLASALAALLGAAFPAVINSQECALGSFTLEFEGACDAAAVYEAFADQVFDVAGATTPGCTTTAEEDLDAKLAAAGFSDASELCDEVYKTQNEVPFTDAANRGTDLHFEQMFYNGRGDWQEEVETIYETEDNTHTSRLREDAAHIRQFFRGVAQGKRVSWPGELPNFQSSVSDEDGSPTCTTSAAMCCWPKDRQANDNNGNCATAYDKNCVDKDPADNTDLCFVDTERGNASTGIEGSDIIVFPGDNNDGEGAIHCHGFAWGNDSNDHTARYKANNLFFVSMYDHLHQRGYVENIPGAPMCGCVEQMPTVSRSDCTQVDLTETVSITYDSATTTFDSRLTAVHINFNACRGINNRNNDLWAYMGRLYYQGDITADQWGEAGRIITNTGCHEATRFQLNSMSLTRGYDHDIGTWTKVAGRDDMFDGHFYGREAFEAVFFNKPFPIMMRICVTCVDTHQKVFYRRLTAVENDFDLLNHILRVHNNGGGQNVWGEDFTLHSTYEDAQSGANPWLCPGGAFNYNAPFVGNCSPSGATVHNQYSNWDWQHGPRTDVAYYVNTPEGEGIQELSIGGSALGPGSDVFESEVDVGSPQVTGRSFLRNDGAFIIHGGGSGTWNQYDGGHYLSKPFAGDIDVSVHVASFSGIISHWARAGLMLRADNGPSSPHVFAQLTGRYGSILSTRLSEGGYTNHVGGWHRTGDFQKSEWIRLVKKGVDVEFYWKDTDNNWVLHQATTIAFPEDTYRVGLFVTSSYNHHLLLSEAVFEDFHVQEYLYPTASPSISNAPTAFDDIAQVGESYPYPATVSFNPGNNVTTYQGKGTGIMGSSDSFFFQNYQQALGDGAFDVVIYSQNFHTGYKFAKGGIMIRDNKDPDAAFAFLGMSGYYDGVTFLSRGTTGERTSHHQTQAVTGHKAWMKLSRAAAGNVVTAYYKLDEADEWMEYGSVEVGFTGSTVYVGVAVATGEESEWAYVNFETKSFAVTNVV